ncbi:MAG: hypothetical protein K0R14_1645 [Burkholderiales bacterium]|jgi:hypothetical protein|nr:hypothetical protein [Burkholderiales bacterium]
MKSSNLKDYLLGILIILLCISTVEASPIGNTVRTLAYCSGKSVYDKRFAYRTGINNFYADNKDKEFILAINYIPFDRYNSKSDPAVIGVNLKWLKTNTQVLMTAASTGYNQNVNYADKRENCYYINKLTGSARADGINIGLTPKTPYPGDSDIKIYDWSLTFKGLVSDYNEHNVPQNFAVAELNFEGDGTSKSFPCLLDLDSDSEHTSGASLNLNEIVNIGTAHLYAKDDIPQMCKIIK